MYMSIYIYTDVWVDESGFKLPPELCVFSSGVLSIYYVESGLKEVNVCDFEGKLSVQT